MSGESWLCAYAITRAHPTRSDLGGARLVRYRGLGVVVAEAERARFEGLDTADPVDGALADLVREHDAVVRAAFRYEPVLPLRFGTVVDGELAAVRLLRTGYERARACLDEVEGHREWGIRVRYTHPVEPRPDPAGLTGTEFLLRRRDRLKAAQRSREDVVRTAELFESALRRHATGTTGRALPHGVLVNNAYLVASACEAAFHGEVEWFARELLGAGATVETTGPWPPYSFTDFELGVAADG